MNQNRNLIAAVLLCTGILVAWQYFFAAPEMKAQQARQTTLTQQEKRQPALGAPGTPNAARGAVKLAREAALKAGGTRVAIDTPTLDGSIQLKGARFDDLRLKRYHQTVDPTSPEIVLLAPQSTDYPFFAQFGWVAGDSRMPVPGDNSVWTQEGSGTLSPGHPVTLTWDNGRGLVFTRTIAIDDHYMFTVRDTVRNRGNGAVTLYPYAFVAKTGVEHAQHYYVLHEGFVGVAENRLKDANYDAFKDAGAAPETFSSTGGWVGITDKYWMAAIIPPQSEKYDGRYSGTGTDATDKSYQADYRLAPRTIAPGASAGIEHRMFAGAKVVDILRGYERNLGIARFDLAVDWGWFIFITQPLFWILDQLYRFFGNFVLALLSLTVLVKILFFPLANVSFKSMSRMRKVQPEMERIKKRHGDDPAKQQQEMMALYKREKVNPLAGCLPIVIQIPVFFSLYKVLIVTIEMYHAPFIGWIRDLSAIDPTSYINLFGLLPFTVPSFIPAFLSIGAWPILLGITQWVQMKLNPPPADPIQARMFTFMPVIFTFMFATLPAGLVIYYFWNNLLTIAQQWFMMWREGVPVHLFGPPKTEKKS